jgi:hypothetical protein
MLPKLEERRRQLMEELVQIQRQMQQLKVLASPWPVQPAAGAPGCEAYIDEAFKNLNKPMTVHGLRSVILQMTGKTWAISTIYGVLGEGKKTGKYHHADSHWSAKEQP